jgi:hypothetical protein
MSQKARQAGDPTDMVLAEARIIYDKISLGDEHHGIPYSDLMRLCLMVWERLTW